MVVFEHFRDLSRDSINRDLQLHTSWTDGSATVADMVKAATEVGLQEIAFTEHARADSNYWPRYLHEVKEVASHSDIPKIWSGFEVKAKDRRGTLDISPGMRSAADIILGSVHRFPRGSGLLSPNEMEPSACFREETRLALGAIRHGGAHVLAHAGGMSLRNHGSFPLDNMREIIAEARLNDVAFEINSSYHSGIIEDLLALLDEQNPLVSIGSDAHSPDEVGKCRNLLMTVFGW